MKILQSHSDQVIGIRSVVDHKKVIGHSSMIIIFRKQKKNFFFVWLARPKNLPCNQIWWRERVKKIIFSRLIFTASYHHLRWFAASVTTFRYLEIKNVLKHVIYMPTRRNALKYTCFSYWICKLHHDLDTDMYVCSIY